MARNYVRVLRRETIRLLQHVRSKPGNPSPRVAAQGTSRALSPSTVAYQTSGAAQDLPIHGAYPQAMGRVTAPSICPRCDVVWLIKGRYSRNAAVVRCRIERIDSLAPSWCRRECRRLQRDNLDDGPATIRMTQRRRRGDGGRA